jgi:large subunit ribosomal protein L16
MMFELEGVPREVAETAMALAAAKLGVKTKFVVREEAHVEGGAAAPRPRAEGGQVNAEA